PGRRRRDHPPPRRRTHREDHDLPPAGRTLRPRAPRRDCGRGHQGPGPPPQGRREGRGRHPPGGSRRHEGPLAPTGEGARVVPRRPADLRGAARAL
ncbi:MAG: hypothetical protein AVDCRST_MAG35-2076, partial [uncultured Quadrisphaera sp.]